MKARAMFTLPVGVVMDEASRPFFEQFAAKSAATVEIIRVERKGDKEIEVLVELDCRVVVTLRGDRGLKNPNICVSLEPSD